MKQILKIFIAFIGFGLLANSPVIAKKITIGAKDFTEQIILAEISAQILEKNGFKVDREFNHPTNLLREAIENGEVDFYFEYNGTAYTVFYNQKDYKIMRDSQALTSWLKDKDKDKGIIWFESLKFNNTYSLMMRKDQSEKYNIYSLSDLVAFVNKNPNKFIFSVNTDFYTRPDGFKEMMKFYKMTNQINVKKMVSGLIYKALLDKQIDVGMGYTTDGRISAWGFVNLEDDKQYFPVYYPSPVIRQDVLSKHPDVIPLLQPVVGSLTNKCMQNLSAQVDIDKKNVTDVVKKWLKDKNI